MAGKRFAELMVLMLLAGVACQKHKAKPTQPGTSNSPIATDTIINIGNGITYKMVAIPGGTFQMGSVLYADEQPIHGVTISPFRMGETEVTQGLYNAVMDTNPAHFDSGAMYPVEMVSWYDAVLFCNELSKVTGKDTVYIYSGMIGTSVVIDYTKNGYRLPTEAEWEYACRAGTTTDYYWGKNYPPTTSADTMAINSNAVCDFYRFINCTQPVAGKEANAWLLYDMVGNVAERTNDWYDTYMAAEQTNPTGPAIAKTYRVRRGGRWWSNPFILRSAERGADEPDFRGYDDGFRIACRP